MSQFLVLLLLIGALLLPVIGAVGLRLLRPRLNDRRFYSVATVLFGITVFSVVVLARSDVATIRLAGLAILLPDNGLPEIPTQLLPASDGQAIDPVTGATNQPTTPLLPPLEQATATEIRTALTPITTLQPTDTLSITATLIPPTETPIPPTATLVPPTETPIPPTATLVPPTETPIPPTATAAPAGPRRYTIQSGDTLRGIAERFGVTVQAILRANKLTAAQADALRPGQELVIP
jgi:LysM repeat protein